MINVTRSSNMKHYTKEQTAENISFTRQNLYNCTCILLLLYIIRPHRSIAYADAAYCYRRSSEVCLSVSLSVCHNHEPCKSDRTNRDALWVVDSGEPKEPCLIVVQISLWEVAILRGKGWPIVKFME